MLITQTELVTSDLMSMTCGKTVVLITGGVQAQGWWKTVGRKGPTVDESASIRPGGSDRGAERAKVGRVINTQSTQWSISLR